MEFKVYIMSLKLFFGTQEEERGNVAGYSKSDAILSLTLQRFPIAYLFFRCFDQILRFSGCCFSVFVIFWILKLRGPKSYLKCQIYMKRLRNRSDFPIFWNCFTKMMENWFNYNLKRPLEPINAPFLVKS